MPYDAAVIRYDGKRRTVWRIKYRDADGRQIMGVVDSKTEEGSDRSRSPRGFKRS
jgi:hypothetical protein